MPEVYGAVRTEGGEPAALAIEGEDLDLSATAPQYQGLHAQFIEIPQPRGPVVAPGGKPAALGVEGEGMNPTVVPAELPRLGLGVL